MFCVVPPGAICENMPPVFADENSPEFVGVKVKGFCGWLKRPPGLFDG